MTRLNIYAMHAFPNFISYLDSVGVYCCSTTCQFSVAVCCYQNTNVHLLHVSSVTRQFPLAFLAVPRVKLHPTGVATAARCWYRSFIGL